MPSAAPMTDEELEDHLQAIITHELEFLGDLYDDPIDLRPPASKEQIAACERFLGRDFPPSYRHFLALHNGLKVEDVWYFMGTEDYRSEAAQTQIAMINRSCFDIAEVDVADLPDEVFQPQNLYPMLDGNVSVPPHLRHLKDFSDNFEECREVLHDPRTSFCVPDTYLFLPRHTVISVALGDPALKFLDTGTRFADGEMNLFLYIHGVQGSYADFYDYLRLWDDLL